LIHLVVLKAAMSTSTEATTETGVRLADWQAGVVGGIAGAVAMAVLVSIMNAAVLQGAIPALYGLSGGVAGWVVHLSHGAISAWSSPRSSNESIRASTLPAPSPDWASFGAS